eukprot:CAMPEP_0174231620 /NCGR_PEP_ID=MMETSP0417-20130205/2119_1 /TAXON_ID=242541 /ORGANISM="Mayorella sp, Strain BSH-02190019" /LENGTH=47 /DNA_ID= /DNA_START= /DNA_END= /DNA_ORIENTATION=
MSSSKSGIAYASAAARYPPEYPASATSDSLSDSDPDNVEVAEDSVAS